ncbi:thiamine pyrophosphate-binding protein [Desulfosporosinus burensis]
MALWGVEKVEEQGWGEVKAETKRMTGAQFIVTFLARKGVTQIYGIPGAAILPFYDEVFEREDMRSINVRHEQTAIFMADGYARSTGKVGVCAATSGPGATNFLTGLYSAYGDSIPLLAITGQVPTDLLGTDAFQEAPIVEMATPVTKAAYLVKKTSELPKVMQEAWKLATQGRKGPVLIDLPIDVQKGIIIINVEDYLNEEIVSPITEVTHSQLEQALTMIQEAERPIIMVGGGVVLGNASEELLALAELLEIPVVSTLMGKDGFPNYHRLYAGMVGTMCQTPLGNKTLLGSDLILNLGGRFDSRSTGAMAVFKKGRKVIHVNIDKTELSRNVLAELEIVSDVKDFLRQFNHRIRRSAYKPKTEAQERVQILQEDRIKLARQTDFETRPMKPQQAIIEVRKGLHRNAIVTLDCGLSQIWATQLFEAYEPRTFLITGRAGTMGWGLGAAMGAQLAYPQRQVVNLLGDASLGMSLQDLATAAKHNIPVVVVVLNNSLFGLIRQQQNLLFNRRWISTELDYENTVQGHQRGLDFVATAKGMGVEAELIDKPEEITEALARAFSTNRPYLIEILVDPDAQCSVSLDGTISGVKELN